MYAYYVVFTSGQDTRSADVHIDTPEITGAMDRYKLMEQLWTATGQAGMRCGGQLTIISWQRMPADDKQSLDQ